MAIPTRQITGIAFGHSSEQVVLGLINVKEIFSACDRVFAVPVGVTVLSVTLLALSAIQKGLRWLQQRNSNSPFNIPPNIEEDSADLSTLTKREQFRNHIEQHGGNFTFSCKLARLAVSLILLVLSILNLRDMVASKTIETMWPRPDEVIYFAVCLTYGYSALLSALSIVATQQRSRDYIRHLNVIFLSFFGVYGYRDILPLARFDQSPADAEEGVTLWVKVSLLFVNAIIIPLVTPYQYIPVDPKHPSANPNPEQTASLLSLLSYSFLSPFVFQAYQVPKVSDDLLPPLADYDRAQYLMANALPHLDSYSRSDNQHLFWGLLRVFRREYMTLATMLILHAFLVFGSPYGIKQLLSYLENDGQEATYRPWVWILWLCVGPVATSVVIQRYVFTSTRTLVRTEGILTQLIFEHSLRIRMKAETESKTSPQPPGPSKNAPKAQHASSSSDLVGKINNLVTTDMGNITAAKDFLIPMIQFPLQLTLSTWFLYGVLGWSAFVGLACIVLLSFVPGYIAKTVQAVQKERLRRTDGRVQAVTETMNVIRMIKLFGWEKTMSGRIATKREDELVWLWKKQMLQLVNENLPDTSSCDDGHFLNLTLIEKQRLTPSKVFSSMAVFDLLRMQLHMVVHYVNLSVVGKVSLDRVNAFLHEAELLDRFSDDNAACSVGSSMTGFEDEKIGFQDATFLWSKDSEASPTPSGGRAFSLRIPGEVIFKRGQVNLIVGPTGSGKTSILMALLGEMHFQPSNLESWFDLPRGGGVAYAAQESWVLNETIKDNILFNSPYDEKRYQKVLYQCALTKDLELFDAGDATEVGERGLTLSGGQKARLTLARAVYSSAEILLLDDVLAALDVHTAKWIVDKCFKGDLLRGRTVLLVTHNIGLTRPIAAFSVSVGPDGIVQSQPLGALPEVDQSEEQETAEDTVETPDATLPAQVAKPTKQNGKLIAAEETAEGHVGLSAMKMYLLALGGSRKILFFSAVICGLLFGSIIHGVETWYLGYWSSQYETRDPSEVNVGYYLSIYGSILLSGLVISGSAYAVYVFGMLRASRSIHESLVKSVLGTTLRWLDKTPISRVITRCTQDVRAVDGPVSEYLWYLSEMTADLLVKLTAVVLFTPSFILPGILVAIVGGWCGKIYIRAQLAVKREMSNAKAPVLANFNAAIVGLSSLRAYGAQHKFRTESYQRIDRYTRVARTFWNLTRWVGVRIDLISGLFAGGLAALLVYTKGNSALNTGFSLNMAVGFSGLILSWVRLFNMFEVSGNSLERIQAYLEIEQEAEQTRAGVPPAHWPSSGELYVEKLRARYSPDGPEILHDLSFHVKSGERIGVVGRTGSGKSSLTLSLLRCIITEGTVIFDGVDIQSINLDSLRSSITIIPQIPEMLSGSLRTNLDPLQERDDATLNSALKAAGLFSLQSDTDENKLTLDSNIASGGGNLSVGQRQILALARAMVRGSKLLILDEATSAIDFQTDAVIQSSLRNEIGDDTTVITVAHRLQSIMDADKIMVLDDGYLVEYGKPSELLKNSSGKLRSLVDESEDRDLLYNMAK